MQELIKDKSIFELIEKIKAQTDFSQAEIVDHWEALLCSIGIKKGIRMVYIDGLDFYDGKPDGYYYNLELLDEDDATNVNVLREGSHITQEELITVIKTFLEI